MTLHMLKTWPGFFDAVADGSKTFEVRWNDRKFKVGDCLKLYNYDPAIGYLGGEITRWVTYVLSADALPGLRPGFVVLGLSSSEIVRILDARAPLAYDPAKCGGLFDHCAYADLHVAPCEGCAAAWAVVLQASKP